MAFLFAVEITLSQINAHPFLLLTLVLYSTSPNQFPRRGWIFFLVPLGFWNPSGCQETARVICCVCQSIFEMLTNPLSTCSQTTAFGIREKGWQIWFVWWNTSSNAQTHVHTAGYSTIVRFVLVWFRDSGLTRCGLTFFILTKMPFYCSEDDVQTLLQPHFKSCHLWMQSVIYRDIYILFSKHVFQMVQILVSSIQATVYLRIHNIYKI